ncbi:malonyl-CoA O-methyltransferase [Kushneria avicenniae]|uniref:Malonyl-[acyl-carrier protein] O-methyltransferase n=1 Tax=Kushneria avicenniae TaxID=402385 RepID=A0A1I1MSS8_9GAMM|nr:malonyl-ACP O-methyltransferase BioC [Kushneria avicenniae]SFC88419.1 malonyl-CoA O-methyltransferase [Kushneria avicenniae]
MNADVAPALKHRIAENFSRAARHYDTHAGLQREVADALLGALPLDSALPNRALTRLADIGCGTGHVTAGLRARYPNARITGIDPAPGMLQEATRRRGHDRLTWQSGEAEQMPFADHSLDMVVSSLAIQWCASPAGFLQEAARALRPGGWLAFTTLLDGTLGELKHAFATLDEAPRVNTFLTPPALVNHLHASPLTGHHLSCADHLAFHDSAAESLQALKAVGAATLERPSCRGLMSRQRWACLTRSLERFRTPNGLPTTYRVAFIVTRKPAAPVP